MKFMLVSKTILTSFDKFIGTIYKNIKTEVNFFKFKEI